jgi:hypothetical protein
LTVAVIILLIVIVTQPAIAIIEPENTDESKAFNDYQEIITYIYGIGTINWIKRRGIFRGEVETNQEQKVILCLGGLRLSNSGMEKYNITGVGYVYAPRFIGFSAMSPIMEYYMTGVAFGNIEWELIEF